MTLFLGALLLGGFLGFLSRGHLALPPLRHPWVFLLAVAWEGGLALLAAHGLLPGGLAGPLGQAGVYPLLALGFATNWHLPPARLAAIGALLNATVILANGGHMPVEPGALRLAGLEGQEAFLRGAGDGLHVLAGEGTRLLLLGDWIPLAGRVVSPGDLVLAVALFLLPLAEPGENPPRA